jgi:hypothetical protein
LGSSSPHASQGGNTSTAHTVQVIQSNDVPCNDKDGMDTCSSESSGIADKVPVPVNMQPITGGINDSSCGTGTSPTKDKRYGRVGAGVLEDDPPEAFKFRLLPA